MKQIEKTVFISYRRTNFSWALAIYQDLTFHGYDVFFDFTSIDSGDFEQIILENIRSRAHFLILLTPSALERCINPEDWLRREIETALDAHRNIVPLLFEGFNFSNQSIAKFLTGKLTYLSRYNALRIYGEYFTEAMGRLRQRFLNIPLESVRHPISDAATKAAENQQRAASNAPRVREQQLEAQEWFERGNNAVHSSEKISHYTQAIHLDPKYADAYNNRGYTYFKTGDLSYAMRDFNHAIDLDPSLVSAYLNRGLTYYNQHSRKISEDDPNEVFRKAFGFDSDDPENVDAPGVMSEELDASIIEFSVAIRLDPEYSDAYFFRAVALKEKSDLNGAIADYQKYLDLGVNFKLADQDEVEELISDLKNELRNRTKSNDVSVKDTGREDQETEE
jgi:tetratricopeptide (TPR) repeat protein